jgi:hypothetical protein
VTLGHLLKVNGLALFLFFLAPEKLVHTLMLSLTLTIIDMTVRFDRAVVDLLQRLDMLDDLHGGVPAIHQHSCKGEFLISDLAGIQNPAQSAFWAAHNVRFQCFSPGFVVVEALLVLGKARESPFGKGFMQVQDLSYAEHHEKSNSCPILPVDMTPEEVRDSKAVKEPPPEAVA